MTKVVKVSSPIDEDVVQEKSSKKLKKVLKKLKKLIPKIAGEKLKESKKKEMKRKEKELRASLKNKSKSNSSKSRKGKQKRDSKTKTDDLTDSETEHSPTDYHNTKSIDPSRILETTPEVSRTRKTRSKRRSSGIKGSNHESLKRKKSAKAIKSSPKAEKKSKERSTRSFDRPSKRTSKSKNALVTIDRDFLRREFQKNIRKLVMLNHFFEETALKTLTAQWNVDQKSFSESFSDLGENWYLEDDEDVATKKKNIPPMPPPLKGSLKSPDQSQKRKRKKLTWAPDKELYAVKMSPKYEESAKQKLFYTEEQIKKFRFDKFMEDNYDEFEVVESDEDIDDSSFFEEVVIEESDPGGMEYEKTYSDDEFEYFEVEDDESLDIFGVDDDDASLDIYDI